MNTIIGHSFLLLALVAAILQSTAPMLQLTRAARYAWPLTRIMCFMHGFFVAAAFGVLIFAYVISDFSVANVYLNSHSAKPLIYKITGAWGNHEGSMILWSLILVLYAMVFCCGSRLSLYTRLCTIAIHGFIAMGVLVYIVSVSSPFVQIWPTPLEGQGLNPILQDIGLALHPPMLYFGYVGFGMVFAMALGAMLSGDIERDWAKVARPWVLVPWALLTLGIGLGSWWAYRELGWGGWWFWDPVENVSLLPWFTAVALLHSLVVLQKRGHFLPWVMLLALLTFVMSLLGTFIVRSGLLTSVHSFASDPERGVFILGYIGVVIIVGFGIFAIRPLPKLSTSPYSAVSRETALLINNIFMVTAAFSILIAILYPMLLELFTNHSISVGAPYFNKTILPLLAPTLLLAGIAPFMPWQRANFILINKKIRIIILATLLSVVTTILLHDFDNWLLSAGGVALTAWLLTASIAILVSAYRKTKISLNNIALSMAHAGAAILALGITATGLWSETYEKPITLQEPIIVGDYQFIVTGATESFVANYMRRKATIEVAHKEHAITTLYPELRYYPERGMQTSEASIHSNILRDVYVVMGAGMDNKSAILRIYINRGILAVWCGFAFMALAGILAALGSIRHHARSAL